VKEATDERDEELRVLREQLNAQNKRLVAARLKGGAALAQALTAHAEETTLIPNPNPLTLTLTL